MGVVEIIRQKLIQINHNNVNVEFITARSPIDLYALAENDFLLIKRELSLEEVRWLATFQGDMDIVTSIPESLEAFDALKELETIVSVKFANSIGLCFLHSNNTLYVFDNSLSDESSLTSIVIRLSPVYLKDIDTYLSIDEEVFNTIGKSSNYASETVKQDKEIIITKEHHLEQQELKLLRQKLSEEFSNRYTAIRAEFSGTSPENITISLSSFYKKHGVESGRLRGSWNLFDKKQRREALDAGIVNRAKEAELKNLSVSIPTYERIIRVENLESFRDKMNAIKNDYCAYLDGQNDCHRVGSIKIQKAFSPSSSIEDSFAKLEDYLLRIRVETNQSQSYHDAVRRFIIKEKYKQKPFSERVSLQISSYLFSESQWDDKDFLDKVYKAIQINPDFFDSKIVELVERYLDLYIGREQ